LAYGEKGDFERAIKDYNKAIELNPEDADAYINRGNAYSGLTQYERALEDYNTVIELNPDYVDAYNNRGNAYAEKGNFERAIEDFDKAIELNPVYVSTYNNRGIAYAEKGERERAIEDFDKAIELNPVYALAYFNRGLVYGRSNYYEKEQEDYKKALELEPNYILAMSALSESYIITKNYSGAHEIARGASNIAEENEDIIISHFLMVCSSLFQNKKEDAKRQLNKLIDYLETIKDWSLEWDFSDIAPAIESSDLDEDAKSLMLSLIELLENKITLDEFKNLFLAVQ
jgi:tetratricopeptide (TPR) repeat protein